MGIYPTHLDLLTNYHTIPLQLDQLEMQSLHPSGERPTKILCNQHDNSNRSYLAMREKVSSVNSLIERSPYINNRDINET